MMNNRRPQCSLCRCTAEVHLFGFPVCGYHANNPEHAPPCDGCAERDKAALNELHRHRSEAAEKAIDALSRYKFQMFGYWAGIWVHLNRIIGDNTPNPFREIVHKSREILH